MGAVKRYLEDVTEAMERKQFATARDLVAGWSKDEAERASLALYALETVAEVFGNATPEVIPCPRHAGSYDCSPFCGVCHGTQEVTVLR